MWKVVWMSNDPGGHISVSDKQLCFKFSKTKERKYRIEASKLLEKLNTAKCEFDMPGMLIFPDVVEEDGVRMTGILLKDIPEDNDQAVVSTFDLREALYFFVG